MTSSRSVGCFVAIWAACALAAAQDRPEGAELSGLVRDLEGREYRGAMEGLTTAGRAAVPHLLRYLKSASAIEPGHIRAVRVLGRLGEAAVPAVPDLLDWLPETTAQNAVAVALSRIGPYDRERGQEIRDAIVSAMIGEGTTRIRFVLNSAGYPVLAEAFSRTLLSPDASIAEITLALRDDNPFVRAFGAELLHARGGAHDDAIDALREAVTGTHPKEVVCESSAGTTRRVQLDLDRRIRRLAARALVHVAPEDPRSLPAHLIMLEVVDPTERLESVMALGHLGSAAAPAVPQLLRLLQADLPAIRREAVTALGMIGPAAADAIPVLERLTETTDRQLAERASSALRQIRR